MDLLGSCKDKLTYFRLKELKDVLTQLGVSKQGKKQPSSFMRETGIYGALTVKLKSLAPPPVCIIASKATQHMLLLLHVHNIFICFVGPC
nr:E3 SUMO-protein ligase SIZ1-like isoform X1 [Ipomoea batatas]GMD69427.1 E3 SUMO-protein ligase SIZ1-like isoform X1 [Ipomoea batatas]GMD73534.1 E3 SUMO-protein ligase SIZ1-like isoform X1 [Ipomoea batatas]